MDGCLEGCAGCFLQIVIFAGIIALVYFLYGVFWLALVVAIVFGIFWALGRLTWNFIRKLFK